jgi:hypothetical protein
VRIGRGLGSGRAHRADFGAEAVPSLSLCGAKKQGARLAGAWHFVGKHHRVGAK